MTTRAREFWKGVLIALPLLVALAVFAMSMDSISQWGARTEHAWATWQSLFVILVCSVLGASVALVGAAVFYWRRARPTAYGILASFVALFVLAGAYALLLASAMPGHD